MACRIQNLTKHRLALDLRGGAVIYLKPNEVSQPIREELLYNHIHLHRWLAQGLVRQMDAKMSEVLEHEKKAKARSGPAPAPVPPAADKEVAKEADSKEVRATEEAPAEGSETEKAKPRTRSSPKADSGPKPDK